MRIKSLRLERYPFCARRCLGKKKKKLGENWMVLSIEAYCLRLERRYGFMPGFYVLLIQYKM